ncbi:MAG: flagellar M-ring protein FliF [Gammaproteobacteria bacterium]|uniref:flagellar basal-body MS-ring/collar protein FliF n=1 Tax=Stutzerimonas xanthomarina TaxID=271420 RepID=UPI000E9F2A97|nr:flagellar basal-body MS-ring/collar protein FliF [Stutzerimonas xanthomarina]MBU0813151.1 flagellar M-ring protein FliF [Gammaproteobacteria bacterium]HAW23143.1 flagellar M-ring protein FliF [Pseudomonas sp.]MBK3849784.1 flagellar M-ring protein FliF [Stutzerimonas xanthomarina]MBU0853263.1 flagellar M-ring protein FliF [Gammaproteobacteria bacterium]MBU1300618.1 flagellar M-ring protein FliF [Gammaproteobacteria bacterium]
MLQKIKSKLPAGGLQLDPRVTLAGMAVIAAALAVAVAFYLWRDNGSFRPLHGAGEAFPVAEVMQVLDAEAVQYRIHPQSGQILVREDQLSQARMLLAAKGVKVALPSGYELFDKEEPLGTSQFVQDVRLKRSLEGELARTVMSLKGIQHARVHLAQEENSSFVVSKRAPSTASVMLQLEPGYKLGADQVSAIINLVAGSVPNLKPEDVGVVDQYGALLSRGLNVGGGPAQNWGAVEDYQQKAVANIEEVLAPVLGSGNYRISVAADIDFSQKEETLQSYGETPRLRREVLSNESALDQLALGVPGSLANRPVAPPKEGEEPKPVKGETKGATSLREESTRQLDYDQTVIHVKHAGFALRQQSVAVVLNAAAAPEGGWSDEARAELEAMVRSAVGFKQARGDLLTLSVLPFASVETTLDEVPWWENSQVHALAKLGVAGLIALLLLLIVVRPAVRSLTQRNAPVETDPVALEGTLTGMQGPLPIEAETRATLASPRPSGDGIHVFGELNPLSEIRLPAPGSGLELQIEHLQMLAKNDPERVSEVIKHWIGRNERELNPAS